MSRIDIHSAVAGTVWQITAQPGARVGTGDLIMILESMKLEIEIPAPRDGTLSLTVTEGQAVSVGDVVATLEPV
ncbi:acetyl-CoA carboxylase biotin carboxyl carrier protein subunit [Azospirillum doebereinerae]